MARPTHDSEDWREVREWAGEPDVGELDKPDLGEWEKEPAELPEDGPTGPPWQAARARLEPVGAAPARHQRTKPRTLATVSQVPVRNVAERESHQSGVAPRGAVVMGRVHGSSRAVTTADSRQLH